jgi:hypothetical protein
MGAKKLVVTGSKVAKIVHTLTLCRRYARLPLLSLSLFLFLSRGSRRLLADYNTLLLAML